MIPKKKKYYKVLEGPYIVGLGINCGEIHITEKVFKQLLQLFSEEPEAPEGYVYKLRDDTLEWELVELPEPEPYE